MLIEFVCFQFTGKYSTNLLALHSYDYDDGDNIEFEVDQQHLLKLALTTNSRSIKKFYIFLYWKMSELVAKGFLAGKSALSVSLSLTHLQFMMENSRQF